MSNSLSTSYERKLISNVVELNDTFSTIIICDQALLYTKKLVLFVNEFQYMAYDDDFDDFLMVTDYVSKLNVCKPELICALVIKFCMFYINCSHTIIT